MNLAISISGRFGNALSPLFSIYQNGEEVDGDVTGGGSISVLSGKFLGGYCAFEQETREDGARKIRLSLIRNYLSTHKATYASVTLLQQSGLPTTAHVVLEDANHSRVYDSGTQPLIPGSGKIILDEML